MKNTFTVLRSKGIKVVSAVAAASVFATPAFADIAADIGAAQTAGVSNVALAVGAVIAIAAVALGVSIIRGLLSR
jgi:hypothetical protein